jgi:hypothetical protein
VVNGSNYSERDPNEDGEESSDRSERERWLSALADHLEYRLLLNKGVPEIAMEEDLPEPVFELQQERLIKAHCTTNPLNLLTRGVWTRHN